MAQNVTPLTVERVTVVDAPAPRWTARARIALPFIAAAVAAVALSSASIYIERHGPQLIIIRETCGPRGKDYCFDPVLKAGYPIAYLYDTPIAPEHLGLKEDSFHRGAFLLDVLIYFAVLVLGREAIPRIRAYRSRPRRVRVAASVPDLREEMAAPLEESRVVEEAVAEQESPVAAEVAVPDAPSAPELTTVRSPTPRETPRTEHASVRTERASHQALARGRRRAEEPSADGELELSRSLVRTYRKFQLKLVGFAMVLYIIALGLIGSAISSTKMFAVASYFTAIGPALITVLVLIFTILELRIRGAGRGDVNPRGWLTRVQRLAASSAILVIIMCLPALGGIAWHLLGDGLPHSIWQPATATINGIVLLAAACFATWASVAGESRARSVSDDRRSAKPTPARPLARSRS